MERLRTPLAFSFAALGTYRGPLHIALELLKTLSVGAYSTNGCCFCVDGTWTTNNTAPRPRYPPPRQTVRSTCASLHSSAALPPSTAATPGLSLGVGRLRIPAIDTGPALLIPTPSVDDDYPRAGWHATPRPAKPARPPLPAAVDALQYPNPTTYEPPWAASASLPPGLAEPPPSSAPLPTADTPDGSYFKLLPPPTPSTPQEPPDPPSLVLDEDSDADPEAPRRQTNRLTGIPRLSCAHTATLRRHHSGRAAPSSAFEHHSPAEGHCTSSSSQPSMTAVREPSRQTTAAPQAV